MKKAILCTLFIATVYGSPTRSKRGIFGEELGGGGFGDISIPEESFGHGGGEFGHGGSEVSGEIFIGEPSYQQAPAPLLPGPWIGEEHGPPIVLAASASAPYPVPVPHPVPVPIIKKILVPYPVPKPYPVIHKVIVPLIKHVPIPTKVIIRSWKGKGW